MATFRVRLVNITIGTSANMQPVCGKSGKLYGHAFTQAVFGGPVWDMSFDEYEQNKNDLIGNSFPGQQWIPTFYRVTGNAAASKKLARYNELQKRAKAAGVWKHGMKTAELEEALTTVH